MEGTFKYVIYLKKDEILHINKEMVLRFGGLFFPGDNSVMNMSSLEYLLEAVGGNISGRDLYPTIFKKAAAYAFLIIKDHIFHDGNKRTGLESAIAFLERNGYLLKDSVPYKDIVCLGFAIENGTIKFEGIVDWFTANTSID